MLVSSIIWPNLSCMQQRFCTAIFVWNRLGFKGHHRSSAQGPKTLRRHWLHSVWHFYDRGRGGRLQEKVWLWYEHVSIMPGDDEPAVDAVLSVEKRGRARRSLPWHSGRAGGHLRSRDSRRTTETALHQSLHQGDVEVTPNSTLSYYLPICDTHRSAIMEFFDILFYSVVFLSFSYFNILLVSLFSVLLVHRVYLRIAPVSKWESNLY